MPGDEIDIEDHPGGQRPAAQPGDSTQRCQARAADDLAARGSPILDRDAMPHPVPGTSQRQQRRRHRDQQDVLDHVDPEELVGELVDRGIDRQHDRRQAADEGGCAPRIAWPPCPSASSSPPQPVEKRRAQHPEERRATGPIQGRGERRKHHSAKVDVYQRGGRADAVDRLHRGDRPIELRFSPKRAAELTK